MRRASESIEAAASPSRQSSSEARTKIRREYSTATKKCTRSRVHNVARELIEFRGLGRRELDRPNSREKSV